MRRASRALLWEPEPRHTLSLEGEAITSRIPHRPPFLLVDRVVAADPAAGRVCATRWLDPEDPVFAGHFPGTPVYPGVLLVEAMGQAGLLALALTTGGPVDVRVTRVHHAVFPAPALPGETLDLRAEILDDDDWTARVLAQAGGPQGVYAACLMEVVRV